MHSTECHSNRNCCCRRRRCKDGTWAKRLDSDDNPDHVALGSGLHFVFHRHAFRTVLWLGCGLVIYHATMGICFIRRVSLLVIKGTFWAVAVEEVCSVEFSSVRQD